MLRTSKQRYREYDNSRSSSGLQAGSDDVCCFPVPGCCLGMDACLLEILRKVLLQLEVPLCREGALVLKGKRGEPAVRQLGD